MRRKSIIPCVLVKLNLVDMFPRENKSKQAKALKPQLWLRESHWEGNSGGSSLVSVVVRHVSELMTLGQSFYQGAPEVRCSILTELQSTVWAAGQREAFIYHLASWNNHDKIELPGVLPFHGAETFHSACAVVWIWTPKALVWGT